MNNTKRGGMKRFDELCNAYDTYLKNASDYHSDCGRLLDKLRYHLLAYLECDQANLVFRSINERKGEKTQEGKPEDDEQYSAQAQPLMQFGDDGFWHIGLMLQLPQTKKPEKKGKMWFQVLVKKQSLKDNDFIIKLIRPSVEKKIPQKDNEEVLKNLCGSIFDEVKRFYEESFETLLAPPNSPKPIGFHVSE